MHSEFPSNVDLLEEPRAISRERASAIFKAPAAEIEGPIEAICERRSDGQIMMAWTALVRGRRADFALAMDRVEP